MKNITIGHFFITIFFVLLFNTAQARVIVWQVGNLDDSHGGFASSERDVIYYQVPPDWQSILSQDDPNWGGFPALLYPSSIDSEQNPQEIQINYCYPADWENPTLAIRAKALSFDPENRHYLEFFKGEILIGRKLAEILPFFPYEARLGFVTKGLNGENRITIRCSGPSGAPLIFDSVSLYIDDTDTDGDGVSDADEGEGASAPATVCIPLRSYDPSIIKRISLHIEQPGDAAPYFRDAGFMDPNSLYLPHWLRSGRVSLYGFLSFTVQAGAPLDQITIRANFIDQISPSGAFYTCQASDQWEEAGFELIDGNTAQITLYDGGAGDFDGERDGVIHAILTLSYPKTLNVDIEKRGCFIDTITGRRGHEKAR